MVISVPDVRRKSRVGPNDCSRRCRSRKTENEKIVDRAIDLAAKGFKPLSPAQANKLKTLTDQLSGAIHVGGDCVFLIGGRVGRGVVWKMKPTNCPRKKTAVWVVLRARRLGIVAVPVERVVPVAAPRPAPAPAPLPRPVPVVRPAAPPPPRRRAREQADPSEPDEPPRRAPRQRLVQRLPAPEEIVGNSQGSRALRALARRGSK